MKKLPIKKVLTDFSINSNTLSDTFIEVVFDDGKSELMTGGDIDLMRYIFKLIDNCEYPIGYLHKYNPVNYYVNDAPSSDTVNKCFQCIKEDIIKHIGIDNPDLQEISLKYDRYMFEITSDIFNNLYKTMISGVYGVNSFDIVEISRHPKIVEARQVVEDDPKYENIERIYKIADEVIKSDDISPGNGLKKLYLSGIGSKGQILQLIAIRGYCSEIDSTIFKYPITSSFNSGLNNLYDLGVESRTAAFALTSSTTSITKSETLSRLMQLAGVYLERLYPGDCGSTEYLTWYVEPKTDEYVGDLKNIQGKYYKITLAEAKWKVIKETDKHLEGKEILIRDTTKCKLKDKHGVCSVCFGELSYNVPYRSNVGQLTSTNLSQAASQALLSTKHHVGSAGTSGVYLDEETKKIFFDNNGTLQVHNDLFNTYEKIILMINSSELSSVLSIKDRKTLNKINTDKLSRVETIDALLMSGDEATNAVRCPIKYNGRYGILTKKLLQYIVDGNYTIDNNRVIIELTTLNKKMPILKLEEKNYSFYEMVSELEKLIKTRSILKGGISRDSIDELVKKVFYLVNKTSLNINLTNISAMLYTYLTKDLPNGNFDLGRNYTSSRPELVSLSNAIDNRSASAALLYDAANSKLADTSLFKTENKPSHPYDVLFFPQERIEEYKKRETYYQGYLNHKRKQFTT
jgi:hypothetical protein